MPTKAEYEAQFDRLNEKWRELEGELLERFPTAAARVRLYREGPHITLLEFTRRGGKRGLFITTYVEGDETADVEHRAVTNAPLADRLRAATMFDELVAAVAQAYAEQWSELEQAIQALDQSFKNLQKKR